MDPGFASRERVEFERRTQSELGFPIGVSSVSLKLEEEKSFEFQRKCWKRKNCSKNSFLEKRKNFLRIVF